MDKAYLTIFTALLHAIEVLEGLKQELMAAQYNAEEDYISATE